MNSHEAYNKIQRTPVSFPWYTKNNQEKSSKTQYVIHVFFQKIPLPNLPWSWFNGFNGSISNMIVSFRLGGPFSTSIHDYGRKGFY